MIKIWCRTNIDDVMQYEKFPEYLPEVPRVGDLIQSATDYKGCRVELEVIRITWKYHEKFRNEEPYWKPEVELTVPKGRFHNFLHWQAWYDYIRGKIEQETYQRRVQDSIPKN